MSGAPGGDASLPFPMIPGVRRIAVLRPSAVGDYAFALPALAALRETYPQAEIVLLGKSWQEEFLAGRPGAVDRVVVVPPVPGMGLPPGFPSGLPQVEDFFRRMNEEDFDLAFQLYGGGRYANPFVRRLGARVTFGLRADDAAPLDRWIAYQPLHNERLRLLEVVALAGATTAALAPHITVTAADRAALGARLQPLERYAVLQPGASDPRRRWSPHHFAKVADVLSRDLGLEIVLNGTEAERGLVIRTIELMHASAHDPGPTLSLAALLALLAGASLVVSNDTGPLHLADAVGTPAVGIYWFLNLLVSSPLRRERHRAAVAFRIACPVCGVENLDEHCGHEVSFVNEVTPQEVIRHAHSLLVRDRAQEDPRSAR